MWECKFKFIVKNKKAKKGTGCFFQKTKKAACPLFGILSLTIKNLAARRARL
jgi:hypothetical protein